VLESKVENVVRSQSM